MRALDYKEAIRLRMIGRSYNEIAKDLNVGKSLLSYWLKDLRLPSEAKKILEGKSNYAKEKFAEYNKQRHETVQNENAKIKKSSVARVKKITNYELLLLGAALYWGEGYKRHGGKRPSPHISFSNSDADMVKVFLCFVRKVLKVPDEKIKPLIHIYPDTNRESAVNFWANVVKIPKSKFSITMKVSKSSQSKRPKYLLPNGTLNLRIHSRKKFFEIMGLIDGLIKQIV